jgi:hypothetical protein
MVGSDLYKFVYGSRDSAEAILVQFQASWQGFDASRRGFLLY